MPLKQASLEKLSTCDEQLQALVKAVAEKTELIVCCGHLNKAEQNKAFKEKKSKLQFPKSRPNCWPSQAVDLAPAKGGKIDWNDLKAFKALAVVVKEVAE